MITSANRSHLISFSTHATTGASADADPLPTAVLTVNGVASAAVVTITKIGTGRYTASFAIPADAPDYAQIELVITATVGTSTATDPVWRVVVVNQLPLSSAQVNAQCDQALADAGVTPTVIGRIDVAVSTRATPEQVQESVDGIQPIVMPALSVVNQEPVPGRKLTGYTGGGFQQKITILDTNRQPISMAGKTLQAVLRDADGVLIGSPVTPTLEGTSSNVVVINVPTEWHATAGSFVYCVWDLDDVTLGEPRPWSRGCYEVAFTAAPVTS